MRGTVHADTTHAKFVHVHTHVSVRSSNLVDDIGILPILVDDIDILLTLVVVFRGVVLKKKKRK